MEKILIIDDSPVQANFLSSILTDDYEVTVVNSAEEGLKQAKTEDFSLILLDVIMPGIDGFQLLKMLQEEVILRHTPVILITSLNDTQHEEQGLTLGAVDYITKPFHPAIVRARVHTHINLYRYRTQIEQAATVDQLTEVPNRRRYDAVSGKRWQDAIRLGAPISICMFDIDKFKVYNDTFGHPAGDKVIKAVAETAASKLRRGTDFFARYGIRGPDPGRRVGSRLRPPAKRPPGGGGFAHPPQSGGFPMGDHQHRRHHRTSQSGVRVRRVLKNGGHHAL